MKKSRNMLVRPRKMVLPQHTLPQFAEACIRHTIKPNTCHRGLLNMSQVLLLILVWLIIMIGLRGLLLVVSHRFTVPVLVLGVRLEKKLLTNLNVRNAKTHTEHCCRCSPSWTHKWEARSGVCNCLATVNQHPPAHHPLNDGYHSVTDELQLS